MIYSNKLNKRFCYWRRGSFSLGLAWLGQFARCSSWLPFNLFLLLDTLLASGCILLFPSPGAGSISAAPCYSPPLPHPPLPSSLAPSQFPQLALSICSICLLALLLLPLPLLHLLFFCLCLVCCFSFFPPAFACLFCALLHFIISSLGPSTLCQARERVVIEFCVCILWSLQFMQR